MKREMKILKEAIRFLIEAAVSGNEAVANGMALYVSSSGEEKLYTLYETNDAMKEAIVSKRPGNLDLNKFMVGVITAVPHEGSYNNAAMIATSAARPGYGPLMYDLVMADNGAIFSDRGSTTAKAKNVWKYYDSSRKDVKSKPIDNVDDPKTPEPEDDGKWVNDPLLDKTYHGSGQPGALEDLKNAHQEFIKEYSGQANVSPEAIAKRIRILSQAFFHQRYKE